MSLNDIDANNVTHTRNVFAIIETTQNNITGHYLFSTRVYKYKLKAFHGIHLTKMEFTM